jgi:DNA-binding NarL/FixJ family response regulator
MFLNWMMMLDLSAPLREQGELAMERPYSVLLADGHPGVRQGIKRILEGMSGLQVVGEAVNGAQLLDILNRNVPDMVIVDISMPGLRDLEAIRKIKENGATKVLFLSMYEHQEYLDYALNSGAEGFVIKQNVDLELSSAIEKIRCGKTFISPFCPGR